MYVVKCLHEGRNNTAITFSQATFYVFSIMLNKINSGCAEVCSLRRMLTHLHIKNQQQTNHLTRGGQTTVYKGWVRELAGVADTDAGSLAAP